MREVGRVQRVSPGPAIELSAPTKTFVLICFLRCSYGAMVLVCVWDSIALGGLLPPALHLQLYAMNTAGTLCTVKLSSGAPELNMSYYGMAILSFILVVFLYLVGFSEFR